MQAKAHNKLSNPAQRASRTGPKRNYTSAALAVAACFSAGTQVAWSNPTNPVVVNGAAQFTTTGNLLTVTNTPNAIINWGSFSVGANEITRFVQQSASSAVLNRVVGQSPSSILGALQSNGRVFVINPNGIVFGAGAQINVGGLVASTLNLSDADFLAGRMRFDGGLGHTIFNSGNISTPSGGSVLMIGSAVTNNGIITSPKGEVILAAGNSVELVNPGTPDLRVQINAPSNEALNLGTIAVEAGRIGIYAGLINQQGTLNANSVVVGENGQITLKAAQNTTLAAGSGTTANGPSGGKIEVISGNNTLVSGIVEAKGQLELPGVEGKGGDIKLLGNLVGLTGNASVDASGINGGGSVLVGGDVQGKNPSVQNAFRTYVGADVTIKADANNTGDGGKVIVWADDVTRFYGTTSAKGGQRAGNGGFVEVSGQNYLAYDGKVDTSAANGQAGNLLLDPGDITIIAGASGAGNIDGSGPPTFTGTNATATLTNGALQNALASNNVTVDANNGGAGSGLGSITVNAPINWVSSKSLTFLTNNNTLAGSNGVLTINQAISGGGALSFSNIGFNGTSEPGTININAAVTATGGVAILNGTTVAGTLNVGSGGSITFAAAQTIQTINNTGGTATFNGNATFTTGGFSGGTTTFNGTANTVTNLTLSNSATVTANGPLNVTGTATLTGTPTLNGGGKIDLMATGGTALDWRGGTISGAGALSLSGGANAIITGTDVTLGRNFDQTNGVVNINGAGSVVMSGNPTWTIGARGSVTLNSTAKQEISGVGNVANNGIVQTSNSGEPSEIATTFNNSGTVKVLSGMTFSGGGTDGTTSVYDIQSGSLSNDLTFSGGTRNIAGTITRSGTALNGVVVSGANLTVDGTNYDKSIGLTTVNSGSLTVNNNVTIANNGLTVNGGTVTFNGNYTQTGGPLTLAGGTVNFNGATTNLGTNNVLLSGATVNFGDNAADTITWSGGSTNTFKLSAGTLDGLGAINLNGGPTVFAWSGGAMQGTGTLATDAFMTSNVTGTLLTLSRPWTNSGTVNLLASANSTLSGTGTFTNQGKGTVNVAPGPGNSTTISVTNFTNDATVNVNSGTLALAGTGTVTDAGAYQLADNSTLSLQAGTRTLNGTVGLQTGPGTGTTVAVAGATVTLGKAAAMSNERLTVSSGSLTLPEAGTNYSPTSTTPSVTVSGAGTLTANTAGVGVMKIPVGGTLTVSGGTITGSAGISDAGAFNWSGGTVTTAGTATLTTTGTTNVAGAVTLGRDWTAGPGATVNLSGAGEVSISTGKTLTLGTAVGASTVNINGTSTTPFKGGGTLTIVAGNTLNDNVATDVDLTGVAFNNNGTVNSASGNLLLGAGAVAGETGTYALGGTAAGNGGTVSLISGSRTTTGGFSGFGNVQVNGSGASWALGNNSIIALSNTTRLKAANGTLSLNDSGGGSGPYTVDRLEVNSGGTFTGGASLVATDLLWSGGTITTTNLGATLTTNNPVTLSGANAMTLDRSWTATGGFNLTSTSTLAINASKTLTVNSASVVNVGAGNTATINGAGTLSNASTIDNQGAGTFAVGGTTTFTNAFGGTLKVSAGAVNIANTAFNDAGTVNVSAGSLNVGSGGTEAGQYTVASGAALTFSGGTRAFASTPTVGSITANGTGSVTFSGGSTTFNAGTNYTQATTGSTTVSGVGTVVNFNISPTVGSFTQTNGAVAGVTAGKTLTVRGNLDLTGGTFDNTNLALAVTGTSNVSLGANAIALTNAANDFGGAVTLSNSGTHNATIVDVSGLSLGAVNVGQNLAVTSGAAGISLSGTVTTGGTQTYNSAVNLGSAATLRSGPNLVTFNSTVDGAQTLTIPDAGGANFTGAVGATTALTSVSVAGPTTLGANVTTTGAQTYSQAIALNANAALASTASGNIILNGATGAKTLNVNTAGATTLGGVYANTSVTTDNPGTVVLNMAAGSGAAFNIGETVVSGTASITGTLSFPNATTLNGDTSLTATNVTFGNTVNSNAIGTPRSLSITGPASFANSVGGTNPLTSLSVTGASTLGGNVTTTGAAGQTYAGGVTLAANVVLDAGAANPVSLGVVTGAGKNLTTTGVTSITGTASNLGVLVANQTLTTIDNIGATSVSITGASTLGGNVTSTGAAGQTYTGAVTGNNITLNAGAGNPISATNAVNDFKGTLGLIGGVVNITDINALSANLTTTGNTTLNAGSNLNITGNSGNLTATTTGAGATNFGAAATTVTGNLNVISAGAISQTGPLTITGTSNVNSGANAITLSNAGNNLGTAITLTSSGANTLSTTGALNVTGAFSNLAGTGAGINANSSAASFTAGNLNSTNGPLTLAASNGNLVINGNINSGTGAFNTSATGSQTLQGGTLTLNDYTIAAGGSGLTLAGGTLNVTNTLTINSGGILNLGGQVVTAGTLNVQGLLKGIGSINGNVFNSGTVSPGNSPGLLNIIGNYVQVNTGVLNIEVGGVTGPGVNFDRVAVTGNTTLNGTLAVQQFNNFVPSIGSGVSFITTGGSSSGAFTSILVPPAFAGVSVVYGSQFTDLLLSSSQAPSGITNSLIAASQPILIYEERDIFTNEEKKDIFKVLQCQ